MCWPFDKYVLFVGIRFQSFAQQFHQIRGERNEFQQMIAGQQFLIDFFKVAIRCYECHRSEMH